jgi:hypothetical protein
MMASVSLCAPMKLTAFVELERQELTVTFISNPFKTIRAGTNDNYRNQTIPKRLEVL